MSTSYHRLLEGRLKKGVSFKLAYLTLMAIACLGQNVRVQGSESSLESNVTPVSGRLESIGVFKNGVIIVEETFDVSAPGRYVTFAPPEPIHGAFFVQSEALVETTSSASEIEIPLADAEDIDWRHDFEGRWLRVVLPGEQTPTTVRVLPLKKRVTNDLSSRTPNVSLYANSSYFNSSVSQNNSSDNVLLQTEEGETIWISNWNSIQSVRLASSELPETVTRAKSRLIFDVKSLPEGKQTASIHLFYLARGATWAPQYKVDLLSATRLSLEESAVIINQWRDLADVKLFLYSGYPQVKYLGVSSPLSPEVDLPQYFQMITQASGSSARTSALVTQQAVLVNNARFLGEDSSMTGDDSTFGDGVDVYAQPVGELTLQKGERSLYKVAQAEADYKRMVYWNIVDVRDAMGRYRTVYSRSTSEGDAPVYGQTTSGEGISDYPNQFLEPWDVIIFKNPFAFPLTTAPASTIMNGRFLGQNDLFWTNPNEQAILPVTKALSLRVRSVENERVFDVTDVQNRERIDVNNSSYLMPDFWGKTVQICGTNYRVAVIDAEITLTNQRDQETEIKISRQFSGVIIPESIENFEPEIKVLTSASSSYPYTWNLRNEMRWTTKLAPKESKVLKFSYQLLILQ
ncbi:MAG: hypothetical protein Q4G03_08030 [Planctomycetia bacterium]|nr:hypothetical protein [Planctomycetia bacterium]